MPRTLHGFHFFCCLVFLASSFPLHTDAALVLSRDPQMVNDFARTVKPALDLAHWDRDIGTVEHSPARNLRASVVDRGGRQWNWLSYSLVC